MRQLDDLLAFQNPCVEAADMPEDLKPDQVLPWFLDLFRQARRGEAALRKIAEGKEVDRGGHTEVVDHDDATEIAVAAPASAPCHEHAALAVLRSLGCIEPCPADIQCQCREAIAGVLARVKE
jgi:hypothetical protein